MWDLFWGLKIISMTVVIGLEGASDHPRVDIIPI
jgi:hypothetical protein